METMGLNQDFFKNKRIFVTGSTGFKGAWLCRMLCLMGAEVTGYALSPPTDPALFDLLGLEQDISQIYADIRDADRLYEAVKHARPEIVVHMAAQPLVRDSYQAPVYTYHVNVMGTVHILEAVRQCGTVRSVINVTTDKVYRNNEQAQGYTETDVLDGYDPYSNSKSCSELVTACYRRSFLNAHHIAVSTCRAGNVIGGGDFSKDRILPDCFKAVQEKKPVFLRNPDSVRPYQHVLESLTAYLLIAQEQYDHPELSGSYNIAPDESHSLTTAQIADYFCRYWGNHASWESTPQTNAPHEANRLVLDSSRIKEKLGWNTVFSPEMAVRSVVEWDKAFIRGEDIKAVTDSQIRQYLSMMLSKGA